jgi:hypothetical protein
VLSAAIVATGMVGTPPATASSSDSVARAAEVLERPDVVSARVLARSSGQRVEVLELRSETDTTWVNPDGTFTTDVAAGPIRVRKNGELVPLG